MQTFNQNSDTLDIKQLSIERARYNFSSYDKPIRLKSRF